MDIYQCPECELRFRNAAEMDEHLKLDHPDFQVRRSSVDEYLASSRRRPDREKRYRPEEDA